MEDIKKLYDIDEQLKYLEQEKHHRCLDMPYRIANISTRNALSYECSDHGKYYPKGAFPESDEVYVYNDTAYRMQTDLFTNSIEKLFKYLYDTGVRSFDIIRFGIGNNEKSLRPSDFYNTDDEEPFDDENKLDKGEELEKAFMCIFQNYPLLDKKLFSLIETLNPDNILMVEQILIGMNKEQ